MALVPATFAFIDKGQNGFPLYIKDAMVDARMLWDFFHKDDSTVLNAMKDILGIDAGSPCFSAVFASYLIDPNSGRVHRNDNDETIDDFLRPVFNRHSELLSEAGMTIIIAQR